MGFFDKIKEKVNLDKIKENVSLDKLKENMSLEKLKNSDLYNRAKTGISDFISTTSFHFVSMEIDTNALIHEDEEDVAEI